MGNWYRGRISQSWNQVFSPADHKIYSFKTEPRQTVRVYERQYTRCSRQWQYQCSSLVLTFPIDIAPISGKFEQGFFIPDNLDGTADVVNPPPNNEPTWERQMLHGYRFLPLRDIADAIWQGDAIVGSDGSAANDNGIYGFSILTNILDGPPTVALKCGGNLPTLTDYIDMDLHCPKGAGLYAALCFVRLLLLDHP
jgi:hypothetical protein